jgi:aminocarboxymuconate-semialdehyde decarboxylase
MDMSALNLVPPVGFVFDTTLALTRMFYDGFLDRFPNLKIIAAHGGGALPYLIGRLDICHEKIPTCRARTDVAPQEYMRRIYLDTVVFRQEALELAVSVAGPDNVLYGSDYPHNIGDMAGCLARVDALASDVRDRVRGENARRIFGI